MRQFAYFCDANIFVSCTYRSELEPEMNKIDFCSILSTVYAADFNLTMNKLYVLLINIKLYSTLDYCAESIKRIYSWCRSSAAFMWSLILMCRFFFDKSS